MHAAGLRGSGGARCRGGSSTAIARPPALAFLSAAPPPSPASRQRRRRDARRPVVLLASASSLSASSSHSAPPPLRRAGPATAAPDYTKLDRNPLNAAVMALFRARMVDALGGADSPLPRGDYAAFVDLTRRLNARPPSETRARTRAILRSLFPAWLPSAFAVLFSGPLPAFSARLNAWATAFACQWLMGPCSVVDVDPAPHAPRAFDGKGMGVKVERCRYLEEAGCAAVCANSCRYPTQAFFARDMGLPLAMEPDFSDFSCTFRFGHRAPEEERAWALEGKGGGGGRGGDGGVCGSPRADDAVMATACFAQCPSPKQRKVGGGGEGDEEGACVCGGIFEGADAASTAARVMVEAEREKRRRQQQQA